MKQRCVIFLWLVRFQRYSHLEVNTRIVTCGWIRAAMTKTPATKQKKTVVTEQNFDSTPSFTRPISTTIITRLYMVEIIPASSSCKVDNIAWKIKGIFLLFLITDCNYVFYNTLRLGKQSLDSFSSCWFWMVIPACLPLQGILKLLVWRQGSCWESMPTMVQS